MWLTTREEGFDTQRLTKRGPFINMNNMISACLRLGFLFQLFSLTFMIITWKLFGGVGLFSYDLDGISSESRENFVFRSSIALFSGIYMIGSAYILFFQASMADDAAWARGFRAGSKLLRLASFFDMLSSIMQFIFYLYIAKFYTSRWYEHFHSGGSELLLLSYIRCLHAISFALYGGCCYLLEVYHDEGAGDLHAYINALLFGSAAIAEFVLVLSNFHSASIGLTYLALFAVTAWAIFFEPEVNNLSPALDETELTNDVEQQVEKFTRMNPYENA